MTETTYDLAILGAGPGGYVAAIRAAQLGLSAVVIEREHLGGVCLNWGCIPTKALLRNAEVARLVQGGGREFGFEVDEVRLDFGAAIDRSRKVSGRLVKGIELLLKKNDVEVIWGAGKLTDAHTIEVALSDSDEGDTQTVTAEHIIIATGARARSIPGVEIDGERVLSAREALERREAPASAIVIGAGPMRVHVSSEDKEGNKTTDTLEAEIALVAIGVRPNSENLGLEAVGIETDRGWIQVDDRMHTAVSNIYAIGDVNGRMPLAHVASDQGILAVETIAGRETAPFDVHRIPRGTYTTPQVASFGLTEAQAKEQGHDVHVGQFSFMANGKALGLGENRGFVKIVADDVTHEILGAVIVGPEATELLPELVLAANAELTPEEIARTVHAHPTLNEVVMEAAHDVFGHTIHGT
ncbi:MAG: FAD-dependent oxidoreductase [Chloroflexi bacterium]|jgi:dihydrolipoamide dehydrogenase|nr:FAD-dependent oxidoreductase [Chloroflexota bacterium]